MDTEDLGTGPSEGTGQIEGRVQTGGTVQIDCDTCPVRGDACADCVVTVLLGPLELDPVAERAIEVLAEHGLVPPLRDPRDRHGPRQVG